MLTYALTAEVCVLKVHQIVNPLFYISKCSENPEQSLYTGKIEENRTYIFTHLFASVTTQWPQRGTASWSAASEILYVMQFAKTKYACHVIDNDRQLILHNLYSIWFVLKCFFDWITYLLISKI